MSLNCKLLPDTKRVMEGLSRMWRKLQVRFLEEGERVIALSYSAIFMSGSVRGLIVTSERLLQ